MVKKRKFKKSGKKGYFTVKRGKKLAVFKKVHGRYKQMTKYR